MYNTSDYLRNGVLYLNNIIRPHHKRLGTLMIYSTTKCQSRCKHCSIWQKPEEHLSLGKIREIMASRCVTRHTVVGLEGGEFLLHPEAQAIMELSTGYSWANAHESMTLNTNKGVYTWEQMDSLTFQRKPQRVCGVPMEKVFAHRNVTTELFGGNHFLPLVQNNQIVAQGYYGAIKGFVDAVEGRGAARAQSLETYADTYSLIDSIRTSVWSQ